MRNNMNKWISVKDQLPEEDTPVIVTYIGGVSGKPHSDVLGAVRDGVWYWYDGFPIEVSKEITVEVTHWMPLPEPPNEEKQVKTIDL